MANRLAKEGVSRNLAFRVLVQAKQAMADVGDMAVKAGIHERRFSVTVGHEKILAIETLQHIAHAGVARNVLEKHGI